MPTLLPNNATALERAVDELFEARINAVVPVKHLWSSQNCPEAYLPWLAWSLSVDNWDSAWPLEVKRQVVAKSVALHQIKGTVAAVKLALDNLKVKAVVTEWFEQSPKGDPYTFVVTAYVKENLKPGTTFLSPELYSYVKQAIDSAKNVRSDYQFQLAVGFNNTISAGACLHSTQHQKTALKTNHQVSTIRSSVSAVASACSLTALKKITLRTV